MKKVLTIIGGIVVGVVVLGLAIFLLVSATSKKLVCKSDKENITIMYNDKTLTGYTVKNVSYDFDNQKEYAKEIGVKAYIKEFKEFFESHTTGTCK